MLVAVEVTDNKVSKKLMSLLKKHENNGVKIVEIKTDEQINIDKLTSEIVELIYNTTDFKYDCETRDDNKIFLRTNYNLTELQALKEILEILRKMIILSEINIRCTFKVTNNFYINVSWYKRNSEEDVNKLQDVVNQVCKKYGVRNDLVILR